MANEIVTTYAGSKTPVAMITKKLDGKVWSFANTDWEAYNASNIDDYDLVLTEDGPPNIYFGDFPTDIAAGTDVIITTYERQSGTFATGDLEYLIKSEDKLWDGSGLSEEEASSTLTDAQTLRLRIGDKDSTLFTANEIADFLTRAGNDLDLATVYALRSLAADYARCAIIAKDGDYTRDVRSIAREFNRQADAWERMIETTPAYGIAKAERPISSIDDIFRHNGEIAEVD